MKKSQSGFTLIELVMVIVILGVLAAVALPKFVDLKSDAQLAAIQGAAGALSSASAINYSTAAVRGASTCSGAAAGCIRLNGATPAATLVGSLATPGMVTGWDYTNFTITTDTTACAAIAGATVQATLTYLNSSPAKTATATIVCTG